MTDRVFLGGITNTTLHYGTDGSVTVEEKQDCQDILDSNQRARDHRFSGRSPEGFVEEAFEIPMVLMWRWKLECGLDKTNREYEAYVNVQLKKPEYAYLISAPKVRDARVIIRGTR